MSIFIGTLVVKQTVTLELFPPPEAWTLLRRDHGPEPALHRTGLHSLAPRLPEAQHTQAARGGLAGNDTQLTGHRAAALVQRGGKYFKTFSQDLLDSNEEGRARF